MLTAGKLPQTPRAKKVIEYAIEESRRFGHNYVGTEHLLLGLIREQDGVAAVVLRFMELQLEQVRNEVLDLLGAEDNKVVVYRTPEAQQAAANAGRAATDLGHPAIGTGHLLLGLLEEEGGMAAKLLAKLGVKAEMVREEIVKRGGKESEA
jgi:ATP-dependent Clp protease ATP-binding subunit ClpC